MFEHAITLHPELVAGWPSGLERRTGDRVVLGSNPAATSVQNFSNSVYPTLPASFAGHTKTLLSGVYARGS